MPDRLMARHWTLVYPLVWRMYRPEEPDKLHGLLVTRRPGDLSEPVAEIHVGASVPTMGLALKIASLYSRKPATRWYSRKITDLRARSPDQWPGWLYDFVYVCGKQIGCYIGPGRTLVCDTSNVPELLAA